MLAPLNIRPKLLSLMTDQLAPPPFPQTHNMLHPFDPGHAIMARELPERCGRPVPHVAVEVPHEVPRRVGVEEVFAEDALLALQLLAQYLEQGKGRAISHP